MIATMHEAEEVEADLMSHLDECGRHAFFYD